MPESEFICRSCACWPEPPLHCQCSEAQRVGNTDQACVAICVHSCGLADLSNRMCVHMEQECCRRTCKEYTCSAGWATNPAAANEIGTWLACLQAFALLLSYAACCKYYW